MTLLLLPVLPYFSQLYLIKMDISWNISNLREVSWPEMHLRTCFPLGEVILGPKRVTLRANWIFFIFCEISLRKMGKFVKNRAKQPKVG